MKQIPEKPTHFFIDADPIAYRGASIAEKVVYTFIKQDSDGNEIERCQETFTSAKDAATWLDSEGMFGDSDWVRISYKDYKPLEEAIEALENVVNDYINTCRKFCKDGFEPVLEGYLTQSNCIKVKDIGGLENRYQGNRENLERPKWLKECRDYLIQNYGWIKMAKKGWEADTHVIAKAEKKGYKGCVVSIDKDLGQAEGTWFINTNPEFSKRELQQCTELGTLYEVTSNKGKVDIKGLGFKFLCLQAICGDTADHYKGLSGIGPAKAYAALKDCETKESCIEELYKIYSSKLKKGMLCKKAKEAGAKPEAGFIKYISWDGRRRKLNTIELMNQHFFLAYQERSSKDSFDVLRYLNIQE